MAREFGGSTDVVERSCLSPPVGHLVIQDLPIFLGEDVQTVVCYE